MSTYLFYLSSVLAAISLFTGLVVARCGLRATERTENVQEAFIILAAGALVTGLIAGLIEALI